MIDVLDRIQDICASGIQVTWRPQRISCWLWYGFVVFDSNILPKLRDLHRSLQVARSC